MKYMENSASEICKLYIYLLLTKLVHVNTSTIVSNYSPMNWVARLSQSHECNEVNILGAHWYYG